jgi:hypothetical protein
MEEDARIEWRFGMWDEFEIRYLRLEGGAVSFGRASWGRHVEYIEMFSMQPE